MKRSKVTVTAWGDRVCAKQCLLTYVTNDPQKAETILNGQLPYAVILEESDAKDFADCVNNCGGKATVKPMS